MKMITNLFSTFDPSSSMLNLSWIILLLVPFIYTKKIWANNNTTATIISFVYKTFIKEISYTLSKETKPSQKLIIIMFITILPLNFIALYPQIFSATAHLSITLPFSLSIWLFVMLLGWRKKTKHILAHLVPQGTPLALINFIVLIELVRNLIRPITLCVRLTANMIAGHLLISLLGSALIELSLTSFRVTLAVPTILTILEIAVATIQRYVFITLISLYVAELQYDNKI